MFGDINQVTIMGNITRDPELRYTPSSTAVLNFSVATNRRYKQNDEWLDATDYHEVVAWSKLAEMLNERVHKGTRLIVMGRLTTRSWEGKDGQKKYRTEVVAEEVRLIDRFNSKDSAPKASTADETIDPDDLPF